MHIDLGDRVMKLYIPSHRSNADQMIFFRCHIERPTERQTATKSVNTLLKCNEEEKNATNSSKKATSTGKNCIKLLNWTLLEVKLCSLNGTLCFTMNWNRQIRLLLRMLLNVLVCYFVRFTLWPYAYMCVCVNKCDGHLNFVWRIFFVLYLLKITNVLCQVS